MKHEIELTLHDLSGIYITEDRSVQVGVEVLERLFTLRKSCGDSRPKTIWITGWTSLWTISNEAIRIVPEKRLTRDSELCSIAFLGGYWSWIPKKFYDWLTVNRIRYLELEIDEDDYQPVASRVCALYTDEFCRNEVTGLGYRRTSVGPLGDSAGRGDLQNMNEIRFPTPREDWGVIRSFAIIDEVTLRVICAAPLDLPHTVKSGGTPPVFIPGALSITLEYSGLEQQHETSR